MNWLDSTILCFSRYPGQLDICEGLSCPLWISSKESKRIFIVEKVHIYSIYILLMKQCQRNVRSQMMRCLICDLRYWMEDSMPQTCGIWMSIVGKKTWSLHICSDLENLFWRNSHGADSKTGILAQAQEWNKRTRQRTWPEQHSFWNQPAASPFQTRGTNLDKSGRMEHIQTKTIKSLPS